MDVFVTAYIDMSSYLRSVGDNRRYKTSKTLLMLTEVHNIQNY